MVHRSVCRLGQPIRHYKRFLLARRRPYNNLIHYPGKTETALGIAPTDILAIIPAHHCPLLLPSSACCCAALLPSYSTPGISSDRMVLTSASASRTTCSSGLSHQSGGTLRSTVIG